MTSGGSLSNQDLRVAVGAAVGLGIMALSSESVIDIFPIAVLVVGMLSYSLLDDRYSLPEGMDSLVYGAGVALAGVALLVASSAWVSATLVAVGAWFVFDGVAAVLYGKERTEHEYVSESGDDSEEVMSRMMTLRGVYVALRDSSEPRTAEEIAEEEGYPEGRVESALDYLEAKGRVSTEGDRYRAEPQRWGKATPVVGFLKWLPRRILRPFYRIATGGRV